MLSASRTPPSPIRANWTRTTIAPPDWTLRLSPEALAEIRDVVAELRRAPVPLFLLDPADFTLDACRATMAEVCERAQKGPKFAVLDRLPLEEMSRDEAEIGRVHV